MSHTPGPWFASILEADDGWKFVSVGPFEVAEGEDHAEEMIAEVSGINHDAESNGNLIAAAPELLAALKTVRQFIVMEDALKPDYGWRAVIERDIDPIIAKAEGS